MTRGDATDDCDGCGNRGDSTLWGVGVFLSLRWPAFLVNGDCSMRCFHSKSLFMDSSRCTRKKGESLLLCRISYTQKGALFPQFFVHRINFNPPNLADFFAQNQIRLL